MKKRPKGKPILLKRTRTEQSSADITIEVDLTTARLAETVCESLIPETRQPAGFRSRTAVRKRGHVVELSIKANDIVALRAATNTFLRFVSVTLKTINVITPFNRATIRG